MEVTPGHPVYVEERGWVAAEAVAVGDRLRRADGGYARVLAIERRQLAAPVRVYNFTVAGVHSYFVLEVGVLVHNCLPTEANGYYGPPSGYKNVRRIDDPPLTARMGISYDQFTMVSEFTYGKYIYVIDDNGNILLGNRSLKHSQLVKGENVYGAGQIEFHPSGQITIDASSGHYILPVHLENVTKKIYTRPGSRFRDYMQKLLTEKYGVDINRLTFAENMK